MYAGEQDYVRCASEACKRTVKVTSKIYGAWHENPLQQVEPFTFVDEGVLQLERVFADWMDGSITYACFDDGHIQLLTPWTLLRSAYDHSVYGRRECLRIALSSPTQRRVTDFVRFNGVTFSATYRMVVVLCLLPYDEHLTAIARHRL